MVQADIIGASSTFYLYGHGPLAELTDAWAYPLTDGSRTTRQLVDASGNIVLASSYTPWGDTLSVSGSGSFLTGYFGGIMDSATGLLYLGNGQYYDPATGRFLNRSARPNQANPYVPWSGDPLGALMAPLAVMTVVLGRRKKHGKWEVIVIVAVLCFTAGMSLSACTPNQPNPTQEPNNQGTNNPTNGEATTEPGSKPVAADTATVGPTSTCPPTATLVGTPTTTMAPSPTASPTPIVWSLPNASDVPNPEGRPLSIIEKAINNYKSIRDILYSMYGDKAVDINGKIDDIYFMAVIIGGEFGSYSEAYVRMEAVEALGNQYKRQSGYSNMLCFHNCNTETQISWATDVEAIYKGTITEKFTELSSEMEIYLDYAEMAWEGYQNGKRNEFWMWGNVTNSQLKQLGEFYYYDNHRVIEKGHSLYTGTDWFIVWSDWQSLKKDQN